MTVVLCSSPTTVTGAVERAEKPSTAAALPQVPLSYDNTQTTARTVSIT